jgi:hypothetical protein
MVQKLKNSVQLAAVAATTFLVSGSTAYAIDTKTEVNKGLTAAGNDANAADLPALVQNIINVLLFVAGAVAVIMIILGAIRYITSNGDQANVKAAKETIMYSVIGLVVAILAFAIVNFVVSKL